MKSPRIWSNETSPNRAGSSGNSFRPSNDARNSQNGVHRGNHQQPSLSLSGPNLSDINELLPAMPMNLSNDE
jgi:hypothetical protein